MWLKYVITHTTDHNMWLQHVITICDYTHHILQYVITTCDNNMWIHTPLTTICDYTPRTTMCNNNVWLEYDHWLQYKKLHCQQKKHTPHTNTSTVCDYIMCLYITYTPNYRIWLQTLRFTNSVRFHTKQKSW